MAFRTTDQKEKLEAAINRFTYGLDPADRPDAAEYLRRAAKHHGPVVSHYPLWHPFIVGGLLKNGLRATYPYSIPCHENGWDGLDHNIYFQRAFITCPYTDGSAVLASAELSSASLHRMGMVIHARKVDTKLYHPRTTPVLVEACIEDEDGMIDRSVALAGAMRVFASLLEMGGDVVEPWENVKEFFLGSPCGARSSLFVNEKTGATMRRLLAELNKSGVFGDVMAPINRSAR